MNLRLLPLLGISACALLALKLLGLVMGTGAEVSPIESAVAQETVDVPVAESGPDGASGDDLPPGLADGPPVLPESLEIGGSASERAVLESLGKRRRTLQAQEGQLDLRERLLQATEERIQQRVDELKLLEKRIENVVEEKRKQDDNEMAGLVTMYESMKPKDAARIFDRLRLPVLLKVVRQMKPRKMADILGRMSPESAEQLTVALASETPSEPAAKARPSAELPKIPSN